MAEQSSQPGAAMQERGKELPHGNRQMEFADLNIGDLIGKGRFGAVFTGTWKPWNGEVAIKELWDSRLAEMEVSIMSELQHPNIITLYGTTTGNRTPFIVMELAKSGSLYDHIGKNRGQPIVKLSLHWAVDIAEGMRYIHETEMIYGGLKSPAVLLTSSLTAKIGSFGGGHEYFNPPTDEFAWKAPEVIKLKPNSKKSDVFSYGMVLWELMTHEVPFEGSSGLRKRMAIAKGNMPAIPASVEGYLSDMIQQCWRIKPVERPSFVEILEVLKPHLQAKDVLAVLERGDRKIEFKDIQFEKNAKGQMKSIGSGTFGIVFKGQWDQKPVAIKKVEHDNIVVREISLMFELKHHPNIITLYKATFEEDDLYIVMELAECSLYKHIQKHKGKPDIERSLRWAADVAEGMRYLHENDIVHRDLKSLNVLLTTLASVMVAKICDFGTARKLDHKTKATQIGTEEWMAPEVIIGKPYSKRCDLFSYGIVLWELVTHKVPFEGFEGSIIFAIGQGKVQEKLPIPAEMAVYLSSLIRRCWDMDPDERLPFEAVLTVLDKKQMVEEHAIKFAHLDFGKQIGLGGFGEVFKGHWKLKDGTQRAVAIKQTPYQEGTVKEVDIVSKLKHPNIIVLYGTASKAPHLYIVMELAEGSLHKHIQDHKGKPDVTMSLRWAAEVAGGMSYLHGKEIVHRDLKSANASELMVAKICDFGTARLLDHKTKATLAGTYSWMAPEVIQEAPYSKRCDLFSYGILLWELVTHKVPFEELGGVPYKIQVAIVEGKMPAIPADVEGYLSDMIQQCWNMDPEERPSFVEVLEALKPHLQGQQAKAQEEITADSKPRPEHMELLLCAKAAIRVAAEIQDNWQRVARTLYIPKSIRKEIQQQSSDPEQQALAMLKRWLEGDYECEDSDEELPVPSWTMLTGAIMSSGYADLARKIQQRMAHST